MSHPDVIVLGGGIIGLACARELAAAGRRVTLLERLHQGAAASRAAGGMLAPLFEADGPAPLAAAGRAARDLWTEWAPALAAEAGADLDYDRSGALQVALDDEDEEHLERTVAAARRLGEPVAEIGAEELRRRVPGAAPPRRAVLLTGEHRVDNVRVCGALTAACQRRGVSLRYAVRTDDIERLEGAGGPAVRVATHAGPVEAGLLVLAAGAWSGRLPGLPPLPVRPVRGQMALLGGIDWPWSGILRRRDVYLIRRGAGGLVAGATVEEAGFQAHPTVGGVTGLLARARTLCPGLEAARVEAVWAGLRPGTPDDLPLLGRLPGWPVVVATGHYRSGILLAPWTAREVARLAGGGGEELAPFAPGRFGPWPPWPPWPDRAEDAEGAAAAAAAKPGDGEVEGEVERV